MLIMSLQSTGFQRHVVLFWAQSCRGIALVYGISGGHSSQKSSDVGTWTPKVCKIMALMAIIMGLGLLVYILLGFS